MAAGHDAHDAHDDHGHGHDDHGHGGHDDHGSGGDAWVLPPIVIGLVLGAIVIALVGLGVNADAFS